MTEEAHSDLANEWGIKKTDQNGKSRNRWSDPNEHRGGIRGRGRGRGRSGNRRSMGDETVRHNVKDHSERNIRNGKREMNPDPANGSQNGSCSTNGKSFNNDSVSAQNSDEKTDSHVKHLNRSNVKLEDHQDSSKTSAHTSLTLNSQSEVGDMANAVVTNVIETAFTLLKIENPDSKEDFNQNGTSAVVEE